jgi:phosphomannomutase
MPQRILSISGLRGIVNDGLDPKFLVHFAQAFGVLADRGTVVVGRDGRSSGPMVKSAVISGLESVGCRVIDAGIVATPTCGFLIRHLNAAGGLQITASHNPIEWNGLKPFSREGSVFDEATGRKLLELLEKNSVPLAPWNQIGRSEVRADAGQPHLDAVLRCVDVTAIRARRLKVVLDCNHGSGAVLGPKLLEALGCTATILGGTPDGQFEHPPEPLKKTSAAYAKPSAAPAPT